MTLETIVICALVCIVGGLIWMMLGVMDDHHRMQCALDRAHRIVSADDWLKIANAYDRALDGEQSK